MKFKSSLIISGAYLLSLASILVESVTYPGILANKIYFPLWIIVSGCMLLIAGLRLAGKKPSSLLFKFNNWLLLPLSFTFSSLLILVEQSHHPNYVFSQYGIYYAVFSNTVFVCLLTLFLSWTNHFYRRHWQKIVFSLPVIIWVVGFST